MGGIRFGLAEVWLRQSVGPKCCPVIFTDTRQLLLPAKAGH